jgi:hypothetical protein
LRECLDQRISRKGRYVKSKISIHELDDPNPLGCLGSPFFSLCLSVAQVDSVYRAALPAVSNIHTKVILETSTPIQTGNQRSLPGRNLSLTVPALGIAARGHGQMQSWNFVVRLGMQAGVERKRGLRTFETARRACRGNFPGTSARWFSCCQIQT